MRRITPVLLAAALAAGCAEPRTPPSSSRPGRGASREEAPPGAAAAEAPPAPPPPGTVSLDVADQDLEEVLKVLSDRAGVNIIADPGVRESVTIRLDRLPWRQALDAIARRARCQIVEESERLIRLVQPPTISMEFQDADIRTVLLVLARQSGANIVFPADITGRVTLSLRDIPWRQALEVVARTCGYVVVVERPADKGEVLRITAP